MSWKQVKLGSLCEIGRGSSPRPINNQAYFEGGDIPWIKIADATKSTRYIYETKQYVNSYGASFSRLLPKDSLIIAASGTLGFPMFLGLEGCIHDGWMYFKDYNGIEKEYLYYQLIDLGNYFNSQSYGAAIQNINTGILRDTKIILPPLQTQKRIADILSAYDDLIENNLKRIKLLEQAAQNIYKEWFVNMRFPGNENLAINEETGLPEDWVNLKLKDIIEYKVDNRGRNPKYYTESGIPVIDNFLLKDEAYVKISECKRYIDDELFESFIRRYLKPKDILITLVGNGYGSVSIAPKTKSVIIQNTIGLRCNKLCSQYFLYCYLFQNKSDIRSRNRGAAQPSVKVGDLLDMDINIPVLNLINKFTEIVNPNFQLIETLGIQNQSLKAARDILLPRLMNRTIEV